MAEARDGGFRATFVTERVLPDHYSALPKFWGNELAAVCKTNL